jgi:hypothetical protein
MLSVIMLNVVAPLLTTWDPPLSDQVLCFMGVSKFCPKLTICSNSLTVYLPVQTGLNSNPKPWDDEANV